MLKIKKTSKIKGKETEEEVKKVGGEEEETEKESGTLSDGVLDAFEEVAPVDPLLIEDEVVLPEEEEDELDSGDYRPNDEW
jgi:hypothetical protein